MTTNIDKRLSELEKRVNPEDTQITVVVCWPDPDNPERLLREVNGEIVEYISPPDADTIRVGFDLSKV